MTYEAIDPSYCIVGVQGNTKAPVYTVYGDEDQVNAYCLLVNSGNWLYSSRLWFEEDIDDDSAYPDDYIDLSGLHPEIIKNCGDLPELAELLGE